MFEIKLSLLLLKFAVPVIFSLLLLHELVPLRGANEFGTRL